MKRMSFMTVLLSINLGVLFAQPGEYALDFDGSNEYVKSTGTNAVEANSTLTIEAWVRPDELKESVFAAHGYTNLAIGMNSSNQVVSRTWNGSPTINNSGYTLEIDSWYHIAAVFFGGQSTIYVNGLQVGETSSCPNIESPGREYYVGYGVISENDTYFNGQIDEVRIWNDVRTIEEINVNMYKELAGDEANLVAYYQMNNGSGTTLTDITGNGYNGVLINMDNNDWVASGCFAGPGNALDFDGSNDYVTIADNDALDLTNNFTIEAWIYPNTFPAIGGIVSKYATNASLGFTLRLSYNSPYSGISFNQYSTATGILTANTWYHVAAVKDGVTYKVYINGIEQTLSGGPNYSETANADPVNIGVDFQVGGARYFDGQIDEVRIWNDVRTQSEIQENMMRTLDGDEAGLVAYYRIDLEDGTTLYDITGNDHNGTLTNMDENTDWVASTAFNTWLGGENNSWTTAANWSRNIAPSGESVGFYNWAIGNNPTLSSTPTVGNMYIESGASPTISSSFTVNDNLFVNNSISLPSSTSATTISGDMLISSGVTVTLQANSKLTVSGDFENAGTLTIESPTGMGTSGSLITEGSITNTGTMQIERWVSQGTTAADDYNWHSIGLPIAAANAGDYFTGDYLYVFDETADDWSNVINTGTGLSRTDGFITKNTGGDKTYTFTGTFNTGSINTNTLANTGSGYHLVSNPYPSAIDLEAIGRTNIGTTFWVWDPTNGATGNYNAYTIGDNNDNRYVLPCQAFFVYTTGNGVVSFENADRVHNTGTASFKSAREIEQIVLEVHGKGSTDIVRINKSENENFGFKLFSMNPATPQLYASIDDKNYCNYNVNDFSNDMVVPIGFTTTENGTFTIENKSVTDYDVYLNDKLAGSIHKLAPGSKYEFEHNVDNVADRFELMFQTVDVTGLIGTEIGDVKIYAITGAVIIESENTTDVYIYNTSGRKHSISKNVNGIAQINLSPGFYIVQAVQNNKISTKKIVIR